MYAHAEDKEKGLIINRNKIPCFYVQMSIVEILKGNIMKNSIKHSLETIIAKHTDPLFAKELSSWKPNLEAHDIHFMDGKTLTGIAGFVPENAVVIVEGDVHIDGRLVTAGERVENNFLIITGNVKCNDLFVTDDSTTLIAGSVTVKMLHRYTTKLPGDINNCVT